MSDRREITRNTIWSVANEGATVVSATLAVLLMIPRFGAADYGAYASMFGLVGPFAAFAHGGVSLTLFEHLVGEREDLRAVVQSCFSISLLVSLVLAPVCMLLGNLLVDPLSVTTIVLFVTYEFVLTAIILTTISAVQGARGYGVGVVLRVALQVVRISVMLVLVVLGQLTLAHLVVVNFFVFVAFSFALVLLARSKWDVAMRPGRIDRRHLRSTALYSFGVSGSIAQNDGDKVVMEASGHHNDAGVYAAGYRMVMLAMLPLSAFTGSTHWAVLRSAHDETDQIRRARRFSAVALVYAVPAAAVMALAAPLVARVLGSDFDGTPSVIRWLAPVVAIRGISIFPLNGLLGLARNTLRAGLLVGNALFSILMYVLLIPGHSWHGAVAATLISETTLLVAAWVALIRAQHHATARGLAPDDEEIVLAAAVLGVEADEQEGRS